MIQMLDVPLRLTCWSGWSLDGDALLRMVVEPLKVCPSYQRWAGHWGPVLKWYTFLVPV